MIFHLMSARGVPRPVRQKLLGGKFQVISRSGLNNCETALIEALGNFPASDLEQPEGSQVLTLGNRTGVLGQVASDLCQCDAVLHSFDIHHYRGMEENIVAGFRNRIQRRCSADLPEDQSWGWVLFQLNRGNFSTELVYDLLQQAFESMAPHGKILIAIEGTPLWLVKRLKDYFKNVQIESPGRDLSILLATQPKSPPKKKNFRAEVDVTLPDGVSFPMVTYPGIFAHRRTDAGGLALAESTDVMDGDRVFDMGCGAGLIGLAIAQLGALEQLTLVDSHARAIKAATENVELNGRSSIATVIQSDGSEADFQDHLQKYSLFVGNPPYYSQNQVTQRFVELSSEVLMPGGRALFVTKNPEWLAKEMAKYFGEVQFFSRRNYTILRAVKPEPTDA